MKDYSRVSGVLLSVTSLPGPHGIGDFGKEAYRFVDLLSEAGFSLWQILPLNPIGYGHSPYQPYSSFAFDEQFISLDALFEEGLLRKVPRFRDASEKVAYEEVRAFKLPYLRQAFEKDFLAHPYVLNQFVQRHRWVKDWAKFSMFHRRYPMSWSEWPEEARDALKNGKRLSKEDARDVKFEIWLQKKAYEQWRKIHEYAKGKGIAIIGDIPFYVGFDSCDVWTELDGFLIDEATLSPSFIAGVPPDYFSATGQRWGNPIYDWERLERTDFALFKNRILRNSGVYDILRLDHFRAFDTYWKIPSSCETAIDGAWIEAPGYAFFDSLFRDEPSLQGRIIAEDLGDLRPEVLELRDHFRFPGMNVIQFTFPDDQLYHKPGYDEVNSVLYLGTHDNSTTLSYVEGLPLEEQASWKKRLEELGFPAEEDVVGALISFALSKPGKWAIFSAQDLLRLRDDCRTNVPSTVNDVNWTFKLSTLNELGKALKSLSPELEKYGRHS